MLEVAPVLRYVVLSGVKIAVFSLAFGWFICWMAIPRQRDTTIVAKQLVRIGTVQLLFVIAYALLCLYVLLSVSVGVPGKLLLTAVAGLLGAGIGIAQVPPLVHYDVFERLGYGSPRDAALSSALSGFLLCGGPAFAVVIAAATTYAAIPLGIGATVAYVALGPWLVTRLNETAPLPEPVATRCSVLGRTTDRTVRFRLLVDDDSPTAIACGTWPGTPTIFVPDRLLHELDPAELDAVIAHELGHVHDGHLDRRTLDYCALVTVLLFGLLTNPLLAALAAPVGVLIGRRNTVEEYEADAFAARTIGPSGMTAALERLATLGHLPRETNPGFEFLTEHPSVARRVDRLATTE